MEKNLLLSIFCICISVSVIFSCKKEMVESTQDDCTSFLAPIPTEEINLDCPNLVTIPPSLYLSYPVFNPVNPNEIAFLARPNHTNEPWKIWRHNICTNKHKVIAEDAYFSQLDWNPLNWILYPNNNDNRTLYKVHGNETEGERISEFNRAKIIKWFPDGSKFLMVNNFDRLFLFEEDGTSISTILDIDPEAADWKGNQIALCIYPNITILDLDSLEYTDVVYENETVMYSVHFFKENHLLWNTARTIAYTNLETQERTIIKEAKSNETFQHLDLSSDETTIVLQKNVATVIDNCTISDEQYFVLMDTEGNNEQRIIISE